MTALNPRITPHEDFGFFGPDSMTWRVWTHPTSLTIGFVRAVVVEELDPALVAAVDHTQDIYRRPATRYDRTIRYFATVAFGPSAQAVKLADVLVKIHSKAIGIEPYGGQPYDANDPDSQLWILITGWHSVLTAYETYGPGPLTEDEARQYWAECAVAAELQTCRPEDVPRSRDEVREYFARMRPQLSGSPIARKAMNHLLDGAQRISPLPRVLAPVSWLVSRTIRAGVLATMPAWMREMSGLRQSRLVRAAVRPVLKVSFAVARTNRRLQIVALRLIAPGTVEVAAPVLYGVTPVNPVTVSPREARSRLGLDAPAEAHLEWRERQRVRVFGEGREPSDAGLRESEPFLGRT